MLAASRHGEVVILNEPYIEAMARNIAGGVLLWARYNPGIELVENESVAWYRSHLPHHMANGVVTCRLTGEALERFVESLASDNLADNLPMLWFVHPNLHPPELTDLLHKYGNRFLSDSPGMIADLTSLPETPKFGTGIEVKRVESDEELDIWQRVGFEAFGMPDFLAPFFTSASRDIGYSREVPLQNFVGFLDGEPVGASTLYEGDGIGGIYCVGTLAKARGRGIGRAVTLAAMTEARRRGLGVAALQASLLGEPVYKKLGFVEICRVEMWAANLRLA